MGRGENAFAMSQGIPWNFIQIQSSIEFDVIFWNDLTNPPSNYRILYKIDNLPFVSTVSAKLGNEDWERSLKIFTL